MEKKWMIPVVAGLMSLSLMGCSGGMTDSQTNPGAGMTGNDRTIMESSTQYNRVNHQKTTGSDMMKDAHYYASRDGMLPECDDATQQGCKMRKAGERAMNDVERAMRDVGQTADRAMNATDM